MRVVWYMNEKKKKKKLSKSNIINVRRILKKLLFGKSFNDFLEKTYKHKKIGVILKKKKKIKWFSAADIIVWEMDTIAEIQILYRTGNRN